MPIPGAGKSKLCFGPFELDTVERELRRDGKVVKLQQQQVSVLMLLVERAGQIVSREEIHQHIWGSDTFVDFERGINFSINQIRTALGDDANRPRYIETIPRRGYRFLARVESADIEGVEDPKFADLSTLVPGPDGKKSSDAQPSRFRFTRKILSGFVAFLLVGVITWGLLHLRNEEARSVRSSGISPNVKRTPLVTLRGLVSGITFSPDGQQIAFTWSKFGKRDIYIQQIGGGARPLQITHNLDGTSWRVDWSPDGRLLLFGRCGEGNRGILYAIPALGGAERKLTDVACIYGDTGGVWTPDGSAIVFSDQCGLGGPVGIVLLRLATGRRQCIASPDSSTAGLFFPIVSPDGNNVAFIAGPSVKVQDVYIVPLHGGNPRRLTFERSFAWPLMWSKDGRYVIFHSDRGVIDGSGLWRVSVRGSAIEPETVYPHAGSVSRDGRRLAYVDFAGDAGTVWRTVLSSPGGREISQRKIRDSHTLDLSPQLSRDGKKIAFVSDQSGADNIWTSDREGQDPQQLTSLGGELSGSPHWSPDGKWIAFDRRPGGPAQIYVIDENGQNMRPVVSGDCDNNVPIWSRDGKSIYFSSNRTGQWEIWKHDLGSGAEAQITDHGGFVGHESYDGRYLYYMKFFSPGIWRVALSGGEEQRITDRPWGYFWGDWDVTETGIYFLNVDASPRPAVDFYDFTSRQSSTVFSLSQQPIGRNPGMSASRDGRTIFYNQQDQTSTITIADDFQ
jgi:Tol biopolymer transport system component/DNA-binding winged helix-turn-helix (wHTH) protein